MTKLKTTEEMYQEYLDEQANKKINKQFVKKSMKVKPVKVKDDSYGIEKEK